MAVGRGAVNGPAAAATPSFLPQAAAQRANVEGDAASVRKNSADSASKLDLPLVSLADATPDKTFKVEVEVWLSAVPDGLMDKLKKLGFEDNGKSLVSKIRRGRISLAKLNELAAVQEVYFIRLPHR